MKLITWMDWFNHVRLLPINDPRSQEMNHGLSREVLMEAIHCITPEGRVYRGARALRFLGMRLPLFVPAALFLWIPGVLWMAERFYLWVSGNRLILSRIFGCKDACASSGGPPPIPGSYQDRAVVGHDQVAADSLDSLAV